MLNSHVKVVCQVESGQKWLRFAYWCLVVCWQCLQPIPGHLYQMDWERWKGIKDGKERKDKFNKHQIIFTLCSVNDTFKWTNTTALMKLSMISYTHKMTDKTYFQVTSRLSLIVPRSLISTATIWGSAANRSFVSQETLPTTTWLAKLFSSVT